MTISPNTSWTKFKKNSVRYFVVSLTSVIKIKRLWYDLVLNPRNICVKSCKYHYTVTNKFSGGFNTISFFWTLSRSSSCLFFNSFQSASLLCSEVSALRNFTCNGKALNFSWVTFCQHVFTVPSIRT